MIIYLMPEYVNFIGDCCRVLRSDGEVLYEKKLHSVVRGIYRESCIDYNDIKRKSFDILNKKNLAPLYISKYEILIPVKIRKPLLSRDGMYGYINVFEISRINDKEIILKNGKRIEYQDSKKIVLKRKYMAKLLRENLSRVVKPSFSNDYSDIIPVELIDYIFNVIDYIKENKELS